MNKTAIMAIFGLLCFSLALTAQDVTYNFDQATDFSKFKTYKWVDEMKEGAQPNQLLDQQIKSALDAELAKKGLTKTDKDDADLYVGYQAAVGQEKQLNAYNTGGVGWGYGARWGGGMTTATTTTINIGTIVFDMYNPAAKQLVWRSQASKTIDELNAYNTGGVGWGYGARWGGGMTTATTTTINIGTIVFDMYNPAAKQLVWRSQASKTIDEKAKPDKRQKNMAKAAQKMLKNYPPKPKT